MPRQVVPGGAGSKVLAGESHAGQLGVEVLLHTGLDELPEFLRRDILDAVLANPGRACFLEALVEDGHRLVDVARGGVQDDLRELGDTLLAVCHHCLLENVRGVASCQSCYYFLHHIRIVLKSQEVVICYKKPQNVKRSASYMVAATICRMIPMRIKIQGHLEYL